MKKYLLGFCFLLSLGCQGSRDRQPNPIPRDETEQNSTQLDEARVQECYQGDAWTCAVEAAIVRKTNELRSNGPLLQSFETSFASRVWSQAQLQAGKISHDGFPAQRLQVLQENFPNFKIFLRAENVAMTYSNRVEAEDVADELVKLWWNSPGHRKNMEGPYQFLGAGVARSGKIIYATQLFH